MDDSKPPEEKKVPAEGKELTDKNKTPSEIHPSVIFSINAPLGGTGIGTTSYHEIKNADSQGMIKEIYCSGLEVNDLKSKIISFKRLSFFSLIFRGIQKKIYPKFKGNNMIPKIFDSLVAKKMSKPDIFHGWNGSCIKSAKKAKENGSIVIVEQASSHPANQKSIISEEYEKYKVDKSLLPSEESINKSRELFEIADYVLIPSDFVRDSFINDGFPESKLIQIPFGVDTEKFLMVKNKKDKIFRVIFVGSVQLRKGIQYLLEAWDELKLENSELIIVGRVWPDAREVVSRYKNNSSIKFVGFDKNPEKYYSVSDVSVFPSLEEGSALVSYEAMASGLPLIATNNTGSLARDGKDGFIIPIRDVEELKEKIKYFHDNPKQVTKMGKAARKHVEKFTWENYGKNITNTYLDVFRKKQVK